MDNLNLVTQELSSCAKQHVLNARTNLPEKIADSPPDIVEITVNAFKDIANCGENSLFVKNVSWLGELPLEIFNYAKYILHQNDPDVAMKFERMLPKLQRHCPEISVLRQTIPYSQMKYPPPLSVKILNPKIPDKKNFETANPIRKNEIPLGLIYSKMANGARKEPILLSDVCLSKSENLNNLKNNDLRMFSYDNLYHNVADI